MSTKTFDNVKAYFTFTTATTHTANIASGENLANSLGKISKWFTDFNSVVWTGDAATVNGHTVNSDVPAGAEYTDTTYTFSEGTTNGKFNVSVNGGTDTPVTVHGLGTAAYTASTAYATASHTHTVANITDIATNCAAKTHTHAITEVTNLNDTLAAKADIADIPAVPITAIQKNGADITPVGGTVDIIVPTTAEDVGALPDTTRYAAALSLTIDSSTFVVTGQLKDQNGDNLGTAQTIDLPLESVVVGGSYNSQTQKVVLTLRNGSTIEFSVADLVSGLQTELSETNKLNPAYINYDNTHRAVSDAEKSEWNGKQDAIDSSHKLSADLVDDTGATNKFATAEELAQIETNKNNILSIQQTMGDINSVLEEVL